MARPKSIVPRVIGRKRRLARANSTTPAPRARRRSPDPGGRRRTRLNHRINIGATPGEGPVRSQAARPERCGYPDGSRAPGEAFPGGIFRRYHRLAPAAVWSDPIVLLRPGPPRRPDAVARPASSAWLCRALGDSLAGLSRLVT